MSKRFSWTQEFVIVGNQGNMKGFMSVTENEFGRPIHIDLEVKSKEGSMMRGLFKAFASAVSIALQQGIGLEVFVKEFKGWKFEPFGPVLNSENVHQADSILDYMAKELEACYLPKPKEP